MSKAKTAINSVISGQRTADSEKPGTLDDGSDAA
jgi:hypothetical protein